VYGAVPLIPATTNEPLFWFAHIGFVVVTEILSPAVEQLPVVTKILVLKALGPVTVQLPVGGVEGDILNTDPFVYPLNTHLVVPVL
jgi:hypothetical protein